MFVFVFVCVLALCPKGLGSTLRDFSWQQQLPPWSEREREREGEREREREREQ